MCSLYIGLSAVDYKFIPAKKVLHCPQVEMGMSSLLRELRCQKSIDSDGDWEWYKKVRCLLEKMKG